MGCCRFYINRMLQVFVYCNTSNIKHNKTKLSVAVKQEKRKFKVVMMEHINGLSSYLSLFNLQNKKLVYFLIINWWTTENFLRPQCSSGMIKCHIRIIRTRISFIFANTNTSTETLPWCVAKRSGDNFVTLIFDDARIGIFSTTI